MNTFLLASAALLAAGASSPAPLMPVDYILSPEIHRGTLEALKVQVRFRMQSSGSIGFGWQQGWGGEKAMGRFARDITFSGARTISADGERHWRISAAPGSEVTVRYRIVSGYDALPPLQDFDRTVPVVRPNWFSAIGYAVFARPDGSDSWPAAFVWRGAPASFPFASDLQHLSSPTRKGVRPGTTDDVLASTLVGGSAVRLSKINDSAGLQVATIPGTVLDASAFAGLASRITATQRSFWKDREPLPYTITASPVPRKANSRFLSGANFGDGFATWFSLDLPLASVATLISHEYGHNWIPGKLGADYTIEGQEQQEAWFGEGFTDYFGLATALKSGAITPADFRDAWNEILLEYSTSPVRNMAGDEAAKAFFTDDRARRLPYWRGELLAARWTALLRDGKNGIDLHQILLAQRAAAAAHADETPAALFGKIAQSKGLSTSEDVKQFIVRGNTIILAPATFGPCATVVTEQRASFDRGYDERGTAVAAGLVTGLDVHGSAYRAGLRSGMTIVARIGGKVGDSTMPQTLMVRDGNTTRNIKYLPQGHETISVQQMHLVSNDQACITSLSGF